MKLKKFNEMFENSSIEIVPVDSLEDIKNKITDNTSENEVTFSFLDIYKAVVNYEKLTMKIIKETKRSAKGYINISYYRYRSVERIIEAFGDMYKNVQERISDKKEKSKKRKELTNPYIVGDLLYDSWGYGQTNVDFYQVVRVSDKSVWIRSIKGEIVEMTQSDAGLVKPIKDAFVENSELLRKPLQVTYKGDVYVSSRHGSISKYDEGDKGVYYSSYY